MIALYELHADGKRTVNVSINTDLLVKAKSLKIKLSATLETALAEQVAASQRKGGWKKIKQPLRLTTRWLKGVVFFLMN